MMTIYYPMDELNLTTWFEANILRIVFSMLTILVAITLVLIMKIIVLRVKKSKNKRGYAVIKLVESIMKYLVILIAIFLLLGIWGINVTAALIGIGIIVLVVGLAAQDLIKDLISGIGIVIEDQYDVDEIIEVEGFKGRVSKIGLRTTTIVNNFGEIKIIRNGLIKELSNLSRTYSVIEILLEVSYKEDIHSVTKLLEDSLSALNETYPQIIEGPLVVGIEDLTEKGFAIKVTAKTNPEEHYSVNRAMLKIIKETFEKNNITYYGKRDQ